MYLAKLVVRLSRILYIIDFKCLCLYYNIVFFLKFCTHPNLVDHCCLCATKYLTFVVHTNN